MSIATRFPKSWAVPKFDIKDNSLVLYLPLWYPYSDMVGSTIYSYDRNRIACTVTGAIWTPPTGYDFAGGTDRIVGTNNSALDFTTQDFSIWMWIKADSVAAEQILFIRGADSAEGWGLSLSSLDGAFYLDTEQSGANQRTTSAGSLVSAGVWTLIGATRSGATVKLYQNGRETTYDTQGSHLDPTTSTKTFKIGIYDDLVYGPFAGIIGEIWVYNRVPTADEILRLYQVTQWRY